MTGVQTCALPICLSQILWGLKLGHKFMRQTRQKIWGHGQAPVFGGYDSTVGIISLGMIGRYVCELLRPFDINVIAYDPFAEQAQADELGVELVPLDDVFSRAAVVSLHTPNLPSTQKMIQARHFELMRDNATFINTARGAVVDEAGLIEVFTRRPDLQAVLDVTYPEPPEEPSPLYTLDNVVLTPHIAGSMGPECHRMGRYMLDELKRHLAGQPLKWQVTQEKATVMA